MRITIDENIVFAREAFSEFGVIQLLNGRAIKKQYLLDTEILIVRSITKVDEKLLTGTKVKYVGTATIGTDHIDLEYLKANGIHFQSAAGCNSMSVAEYVFSAIVRLCREKNISLKDKSIGIIGVGNVGSKVKKISEAVGLRVIQNDPPLARINKNEKYYSLDEALSSDIVTFHVPLNLSGEDKTFHLLNNENISTIKPASILINTSRGAIIDNQALKKKLELKKDIYTVFDVWENEPEIDFGLYNLVDIATPHIAGYSLEGKVNGTKIIYKALCDYIGTEEHWTPTVSKENRIIELGSKNNLLDNLYSAFAQVYPCWIDDFNFRKNIAGENDLMRQFDLFRKNYWKRHEFSNYKFFGNNYKDSLLKVMKALNIQICKR